MRNHQGKGDESLVLFGCGAMAMEVAQYVVDINGEAGESVFEVTDIVSDDAARYDEICSILGYSPSIHSSVDEVVSFSSKLSLVCIAKPSTIFRLHRLIEQYRGKLVALIHPLAHVSSAAVVGAGAIVCPFVYIGPFSRIGNGVIVNVGSIIGHDAHIGANSVISPRVSINGYADVGTSCFLGAGVTIAPRVKIGCDSDVSAGVAVHRNQESKSLIFAAGQPRAVPKKIIGAD